MILPADTVRQTVNSLNIFISDCETYGETLDNFKNRKLYGMIEQPHSSFEIRVEGTVRTGLDIYEEYTACPLEYAIMKIQTPLTEPGEAIKEYHRSLGLDPLDGPYDKALKIMEGLYRDYHYTPGRTGIHEPAETAFSMGEGVCQDYAHIMLSLLRMEEIPARYVVGMIQGEGSSHAWTEALCRGYWYGFDPTNCKLVNDEYIRISCGRDSGDCPVIRGSFYGLAEQRQQETVLVEEII